jgi:hypothetical protein
LHELSYDETLRLPVLAAVLARASGADQDVDAFITYFCWVVYAKQDEPDLGVPILKGGDGP